MMTLEEYFLKESKEKIKCFYEKIVSPKTHKEDLTKVEMYKRIINTLKEKPEIIFEMCTIEELEGLKELINEKELYDDRGYLEYVTVKDLKDNYLVLKDKSYYIPKDIINYVKMALNILNEEAQAFKDIISSVIIGLVRIYNVIPFNDFSNMLSRYYISIDLKNLKNYFKYNSKINSKVGIKTIKGTLYIYSQEYLYYSDVLKERKEPSNYYFYSLEEVICIGKYKINLFNKETLDFLTFLENHLDPIYIDNILDEIIVYSGFWLEDDFLLRKIADNIDELYTEIKKVLLYLPIWLNKGENKHTSLRKVSKNELCPCGSGKKYKNCCGK